jgi:hypothetical protein
MPIRSTIIGLLLCAAVSAAADPPRLQTLNGTPVSGELLSISAKSVIFKVAGKRDETPLDQVLSVDIAEVPKAPPTEKDTKYIDVELTDGTLLHCGQFAIKGKEVQVTLLSGQDLKFPLADLRWYLTEAQDKRIRQDWEKFLAKKTNFDQLVVKGEPAILNSVQGTIIVVDENGENVNFTVKGRAGPFSKSLETIHGIIFQRGPNPARGAFAVGLTASPQGQGPFLACSALIGGGTDPAQAVCKVFDLHANVIVASAVVTEGDKVRVTTPNGLKLELPRASLARLDYSPGKLVYLSDWKRKEMQMKLEDSGDVRFDTNLDGGPIRLPGHPPFEKGLAIHAHATIEYDLPAGFREFKAILGVDELVGGTDGITKVVIKGDGKELKTYEFSRKDKKALDVKINIQNVKSLSIEVSSAEVLNLGHHVDLADARVLK